MSDLAVSNDGPGFDAAAPEEATGRFGLRGMRERVAQMNGTLQFGRDVHGRTRIEVKVETPEAI